MRADPHRDQAALEAAALEAAALDRIDPDRVLQLANALVAVPSVGPDEAGVQAELTRLLTGTGLAHEVLVLDRPGWREHPYFSAEVERRAPVAVRARFGDAEPGRPTLLLNGHADVVPPGDPAGWTTPPFHPDVREGRLYGRGACDTKGGLAAALHAVEAVRSAGIRLRGEVSLLSVPGEEDGGSGTLGALLAGVSADACVVLEPTGLSVVPAVAGALSFRIRLAGRAAHGAVREEGVSAIGGLPRLLAALEQVEARRNAPARIGPTLAALFPRMQRPFALCAGRVVGGDWPSSESNWCEVEGRYGVAPGEDLDTARRELEEAVARSADGDPWWEAHPPELTWWGGQFLPGQTPTDAPVVTMLQAAVARVTGREAPIEGMPYGCDMGLYRAVGNVPTVVFGPGDIRDAHRPDENVAVADLVTAARVLAVAIVRSCAATAGS